MREVTNPKAPVTRGVTFLGANWSSPTATTMSMADLTSARDLSFDFLSLAWYCSFCNKSQGKRKKDGERQQLARYSVGANVSLLTYCGKVRLVYFMLITVLKLLL